MRTKRRLPLPESYRGIGYSSAIHVFEGDIACKPNDKSKEAAVLHIKVDLGNNSVWVEELSLPAGFKASDDREVYKQRNLVERLINWLKQFRRLATRYEKRAANYRAMWVIAATLLWL